MSLKDRMDLYTMIRLCSGADAWHTKSVPQAEVPILCMSDGPHGLRREREGAGVGAINDSLPATCFPTAVTTACSWDAELLEEIGKALGEEAASMGVGLLLGPGLNIKRNPLCGRNFEYYSEDPLLSGKLAAALARGVESKGVGACLKHFAANSQEYKRFNSDSVMDERTLREIYLRAFEIAVKEAKPSAVMCAYNKLNGEHCSDSRKLLTDILRREWGFDGMVVTDWGAMNDRVRGFEAGCDLVMPGGSDYQEREAEEAVLSGRLDIACVERSAERIARLAERAQAVQKTRPPFDARAHHALARRAAAESAVLLQNRDQLLPINEKYEVLFVGPMARSLRYQGAGSSHINPLDLKQPAELCPEVTVVDGCLPDGSADKKLLKEAVKEAKRGAVTVIFAGLPDQAESEGFDRESMALPKGFNQLINEISAVNPHTVVVLLCGSPVELPWADKVKSILYMGLPGEAGAEAAVDLLFGNACPCGKLAESWPLRCRDCVSAGYYAKDHKDAHYREGLYVGYRYYDKAGVPVRYPFGYGLSYTRFAYGAIRLEGDTVTCRVTNKGKRAGAEIVQLYVEAPEGRCYRPVRELKAFQKVFLKRGESKTLRFALDDRFFAVWQEGWIVPAGDYRVRIGGCSADLPLSVSVHRDGADWQGTAFPAWYLEPQGEPDETAFAQLLGRPAAEEERKKGSYTMDSTILEMQQDSLVMKLVYAVVKQAAASRLHLEKDSPEYRMAMSTAADAPLRALQQFGYLDVSAAEALLAAANGHPAESLRRIL